MTDVKILEDYVNDEDDDGVGAQRFVQLSADYNSYTIQQHVASLRTGGATITYLNSNKKPKQHGFTAEEMDVLTEQWTQFKADLATLKAAKEAEKLAKFKETWAEIENLANSVPGLEISTMDSTWWNHDTQEEMPYTEVRLPAIGFHRVNITLPENILRHVKEAVEQYTSHLHIAEEAEAKGWYGFSGPSRSKGETFLDAHRRFLAQKLSQIVENEPDYVR